VAQLPPRIFSFNTYERDEWVKRQAESISAGSRVLDVGAGPARYRRLFDHCEYKTQDFKKLTPEEAKWAGATDYGDIDYVSDISAIPVPDGSFDVVVCTEVLEHVPEPIAAVAEMSRVLRRGGRLLLTAPQRSGKHQSPFHYYGGFTPEWYRTFLPRYGFTVDSIEPNGGFFRAYGEETQRFVLMVLPPRWRQTAPWLWPAWAILKVWALGVVLLSHGLDRFDVDRGFTVGHHVLATKTA
jgi:ubiquinone/menaquinone biosynthesis C-methylase UbiE